MPPKTDFANTTFASQWSYRLQKKTDAWEQEAVVRWRPGQTVSRQGSVESLLDHELPKAAHKKAPLHVRVATRLNRFRLKTMINLAYHGMGLLSRIDDLLVKYLRGNPNKKQPKKDSTDLSSARPVQDVMTFLATATDQEIADMRLKARLMHQGEVAEQRQHDEYAVKQTRQGVLIRDDPDSLCGVVYPHGLPPAELALYTRPRMLVVKDGTTNKFGHTLLAFGDASSGKDRYMQISSAHWYPEHMNSEQMADYFDKARNKVAYEVHLDCRNEEAMREAINNLSSQPWRWGGTLNNCMTLAKKVAEAGDSPPELFEGLTTLSNRFSNSFHGTIDSSCQLVLIDMRNEFPNHLAQLDELQEQLSEQLFNSPRDLMSELITDARTPTQAVRAVIKESKRIIRSSSLPRKQQNILLKRLNRGCHAGVRREIAALHRQVHGQTARDLLDMPLVSAYNMPVTNRVVGPQSIGSFNEDPELPFQESHSFVDITPLHEAVDDDLFTPGIDQARQRWPDHSTRLNKLNGELYRQIQALPRPNIFTSSIEPDLQPLDDHLHQVLYAIEVTVNEAGLPRNVAEELIATLGQQCINNIDAQLAQVRGTYPPDPEQEKNKAAGVPHPIIQKETVEESEPAPSPLLSLSEKEQEDKLNNMFASVPKLPDDFLGDHSKSRRSRKSDDQPPSTPDDDS